MFQLLKPCALAGSMYEQATLPTLATRQVRLTMPPSRLTPVSTVTLGPAGSYIADSARSYLQGIRLIEHVGTPEFTSISIEIYGKPGDLLPGGKVDNVDAALDQLVAGADLGAAEQTAQAGFEVRPATPPLFETLVTMGRELTRRRVRLCAEYIRKLPAPAVAATPPAAKPATT